MHSRHLKADWCVVGGGVGGCYAAYVLARSGHSVVLLEGGDRLGGVLSSREWQGFHLDNGCHVFDFADAASAEFFNMVMGSDVRPLQVKYASIGPYGKTAGIAVPDFSRAPEEHRGFLLSSVRSAVKAEQLSPKTLSDAVSARFGAPLACELIPGIDKICGSAGNKLSADAFEILSYAKRVRLGPDDEMAVLKKSDPLLDDRLAVKTPPTSTPRNYYPSMGSMNTFCDRLRSFLESAGVTVILGNRVSAVSRESGRVSIKGGQSVDAKKLFWSMPSSTLAFALDGLPDPRPHYHPVCVDIWAMKMPAHNISSETYIHDYTAENPIFRSASVGLYSEQFDDAGNTFVIAEVYDSLSNPARESGEITADTILSNLKSMGQVDPSARVIDATSWRIPTALMLPKTGWRAALKPISDMLEAEKSWLVASALVPRGKRSIFGSVDALLVEHL